MKKPAIKDPKHIIVSGEAMEKLNKISVLRPQDVRMSDTIDHLIYIYEKQSTRSKSGLVLPYRPTEIIDAEKLQKKGEKP
jgi:hypothetical protein